MKEWGLEEARKHLDEVTHLAATKAPQRINNGAEAVVATAAVHGLAIVTRNERDFEGRGVPVINPWRERND